MKGVRLVGFRALKGSIGFSKGPFKGYYRV